VNNKPVTDIRLIGYFVQHPGNRSEERGVNVNKPEFKWNYTAECGKILKEVIGEPEGTRSNKYYFHQITLTLT
jgi:hypothetical protein